MINNNMKPVRRIKTKNIDPSKLITKSQYAKDNKLEPMQVTRMVQRGDLAVVIAKGAELIHL